LGYVVNCQPYSLRDCLGAIFLVESPQKSCEFLSEAINKFLLKYRKIIQNLTDEEF